MNRLPVNTGRAARTWMAAGMLFAALALIGCGTASTKPIRDIKSVAGRWNGNLGYQRAQYGTWNVGATWIIREDGTYEIITPRWSAGGTLNVENGRLFFYSRWAKGFYADGRRASGIARLYEDAEGRYLISAGQPDASGYWWPAK